MRREELALVILGELDESFIDEAMPKKAPASARDDTVGVQRPKEFGEIAEVSKRDVRIYWITHALGMAAVVALIVGAVVLLVQNWDKIAVSGNERPGVVTTVTSDTVTPDITEIDIADRFEQITDTSMPEPYDSMEYPLGNFDFYSQWKPKFFDTEFLTETDSEKIKEFHKRLADIQTPYTLFDSPNLYTAAKAVGFTSDDIEKELRKRNETYSTSGDISKVFSDYEIMVLSHSNDSLSISATFASEYSIYMNTYVFSPKWLYYHTIEDYKAAGIDPYSMHSLLEKYSELGLSEEAWRAFRKKLILYAYSEMYPEKDRVYTYELDVSEPLGDDAFRIFEDMFCGEWKYAGKYDRHDAAFDMTYGGTSFRFGRILGIFETDEIYVIHYSSSGGTLECYVIEKSSPDIMYNTDVLTSLGGIEEIKLGDDEWVKYINRKPAAAELKPGDLSIPGLTYLFHLYGSDFEDYYRAVMERDGYQSISEDEPLYLSYGYTADEYRRCLVDMSKNSVTIALPYVHDNRDTNQTSVYYELTFTKDESGEWSVTYNRSGEVYFYERADSKTYTGGTPDYYEGLLPELEMRDVLRVGESLSFRSAVVTLRTPDGKVRASCPFTSGRVGLSGYSCTAMREPLVQLFNLENRRILIAVGLPLWESEFDRSYLTSFYLYDGDPILRRVEADGDCLEVIVKDSTGISQGEDWTIHCTQPDGLILEYHIGENGHAALTPSQYD